MASFKGFYINRDKDSKRESSLKKELNKKGKLQMYERFRAVEGNAHEAAKKSLRAGEHGLWKSWIKLLEKIESDNNKNYDYVHIIEDDAVVSDGLYSLIEQLNSGGVVADILMTDMYTNISIYNVFRKHVEEYLYSKTPLPLSTTNEYTGCAASCIIHKNKIEKINSLLKGEYGCSSLIPIDNYFRRLSREGSLTIATTIPFLTTVQLSSISESTIQERKSKEETITLTQVYNTHLRRMLSVFREDTSAQEMIEIARTITDTNKAQKDRLNIKLIECLNYFMEKERILRYREDTRLLREEGNPQEID